ncbi:hypothetical protein WMY93_029411 [Mugilogobius chulae]|uniref:Uncharacterized protein n=1 Tax=Mugilogobius chulae TaxID=88201 RepID=A0AAW0MR47_9GOBI
MFELRARDRFSMPACHRFPVRLSGNGTGTEMEGYIAMLRLHQSLSDQCKARRERRRREIHVASNGIPDHSKTKVTPTRQRKATIEVWAGQSIWSGGCVEEELEGLCGCETTNQKQPPTQYHRQHHSTSARKATRHRQPF